MHEATERPQTRAVRRDRYAERGVLIPALLVSALVHAALFALVSFRIPTEPRVSFAPVSQIVQVVPAMQAYDIVESSQDVAPLEVQIIEREMERLEPVRLTPPAAASDDAGADDRAAAEPVDPGLVRDRLRYRLNTPQVWRPPSQEIAVDEPTPQEQVQQRIAAQLGLFNDSIAAEAAAAERASDWTVKDADGGRWGVSPEGIHLGGITIPLGDSHFAVAAGRREEFAGRVRTWNELQDQAVREEAKDQFKDRVKAIEERMNRERAGKPPPPPPPPDTTGSSRGR